MEYGGPISSDYQYQNQIAWEEQTRLAKALNSCEAERDRLKAVNAELVKALNLCAQELADAYHTLDFTDIPEHPARKVFDQACAVLTKATGTSVSINSPAFAEQPEAQANAASWPSGPRKRAKATS